MFASEKHAAFCFARPHLPRFAINLLFTVAVFAASSLFLSAASRDRTPPSTPRSLRVTANTSYTVSLAWNPSTDNSGVFSYRVRHSWGYEASVPQNQTSFTWTGNLEAGRTYGFTVYAIDAAGNRSALSNAVSVRLPQDTLNPSTPTLSLTESGPTHVTLQWSSVDDGPHVWYYVFQDGTPVIQGSANTSGSIHLLQPGTTYTFTVKARDFGGNWSAVSAPLVVTTPPANTSDTTPPTSPTGLTESHWDDGEINLRWTASTDNVDAPANIRYDIYLNGVLTDIATGGRTFSVVYGEDGPDTVTVIAIDSAGNASAPTSITIP